MKRCNQCRTITPAQAAQYCAHSDCPHKEAVAPLEPKQADLPEPKKERKKSKKVANDGQKSHQR
jgi:hypothetical protein